MTPPEMSGMSEPINTTCTRGTCEVCLEQLHHGGVRVKNRRQATFLAPPCKALQRLWNMRIPRSATSSCCT